MGGGLPCYYDGGNNFIDEDNNGEPDLQSVSAAVLQTVTVEGSKGDVFSLGGWVKGYFVKDRTDSKTLDSIFEEGEFLFSNNRYAQLEISYQYEELDENNVSQTVTETVAVPFGSGVSGWQFASQLFALKGDCTQMSVVIRYENLPYTACFGNIELIKSNDIVVPSLTDSETEMTVSLAYDGDRLTDIASGNPSGANVAYKYEHNPWGQISEITVDEATLVSYAYGTGQYRDRLNQITYGNGTVIEYIYDSEGNIYQVNADDGLDIKTYYFYYNSDSLYKIIDDSTQRTVTYYDNCIEITDSDTQALIYRTSYNENGEFVETVGDEKHERTYTAKTYESEYLQTAGTTTEKTAIYSSTGKTIGTTATSDKFSRQIESTVMTKDPTDMESGDFASIITGITYGIYDTDKTTGLVSRLTNKITFRSASTELNFAYDYDNNGNISAEYAVYGDASALRYKYLYDEADQLVRVNDAVRQKTITYSYDSRGNITERKIYIYTTAETLFSPISTDAFGYADSVWEDRLISYNSPSDNVIYDEIGNPESYRGAQLTWSGRQLKSYEKSGKVITFDYDQSGMRYKKTVTENNEVTETYSYIYSDDKLIAVTFTKNNETNTARFIYDLHGELRGFIFNNNQSYLYVKNLQGDIISIVDENGTILLHYSYDSWGDVDYIIPSGTNLLLAAMLATVTPFTFRGYCYDYDIGLYYLKTRYYDPEICRFINADSTDYLGVSTAMSGYNLFAYCNNEPVGTIDTAGTWAYDVHCGYYTDDKIDIYLEGKKYSDIDTRLKNIKRDINCAESTISRHLFSGIKRIYMPYITVNENNVIKYYLYGTYYWAICAGFSGNYAKTIADCCNGIDKLYSPVSMSKENQSWHFNTNWDNENKLDSRVIKYSLCFILAMGMFEEAKELQKQNSSNPEIYNKTLIGIRFLGYGLHPVQDIYAHTRDKCFPTSFNVKTGYASYTTVTVWAHLPGVTDSAQKRFDQLQLAQKHTQSILNGVYKSYSSLFK